MKMTCIMCPVGCELNVNKVGGKIVVKGNSCPRGVIYAEREVVDPARMITTVKQYKGKTLALKTSKPISKGLITQALRLIKDTPVTRSMSTGDVFIKNILNTDVDIVVTSSPDK